jgi:hypothetical protein
LLKYLHIFVKCEVRRGVIERPKRVEFESFYKLKKDGASCWLVFISFKLHGLPNISFCNKTGYSNQARRQLRAVTSATCHKRKIETKCLIIRKLVNFNKLTNLKLKLTKDRKYNKLQAVLPTNSKGKITVDEILIILLSKCFMNITYTACLNYL